MTSAQPVPPGMHTLTPHLVCHSAVDAIMFYIKAFDASELVRRVGPDGRLMHAVLRIGDSPLGGCRVSFRELAASARS